MSVFVSPAFAISSPRRRSRPWCK